MKVLRILLIVFMLPIPGMVFGQNEKHVEPYDGRCESPVPPEALASLLDKVIKDNSGSVTLTLVRHPKPSTRPADARTAWVCMIDRRPLWVVSNKFPESGRANLGFTSHALQLARKFVAANEEFNGKAGAKLRPLDWEPAAETLLPAFQVEHFGCQITEIRLLDRKKMNWKITFEQIEDSSGGEIWVYVADNAVTAEFGK